MALELERGQVELVSYLDAATLARLPATASGSAPLAVTWPSEVGLDRLADVLPFAGRRERERLEREARDFLAVLRCVVRSDALPPSPLEDHVLVTPFGLQLVAETADRKVRVDADLNIVVARRRAVALGAGTTRYEVLKAQLAEVLCVKLADERGRPLETTTRVDLRGVWPDGLYVEVEPPAGSGFVSGRYGSLAAFGDGKLLVVSFARVECRDAHEPAAAAALPFAPITVDDTLGRKKP